MDEVKALAVKRKAKRLRICSKEEFFPVLARAEARAENILGVGELHDTGWPRPRTVVEIAVP